MKNNNQNKKITSQIKLNKINKDKIRKLFIKN
jgi:hypothetical protein